MPQLTTGATAAQQMAEEGGRGGRAFLPDQKFENKKTYFLRPFTDHTGWISVLIHSYIPPKRKPDELTDKDNWPKSMWAMCQNDRAFRLRDSNGDPVEPPAFEPGYGECWIDLNLMDQKDSYGKAGLGKPKKRVYGVFIVVEPVKENGEVAAPGEPAVRFRDQMREYKNKDGEAVMAPALVLVNSSWDAFFAAIKASSYIGPNTVTDKILSVRRVDTDYTVTSVMTTPDCHGAYPAADGSTVSAAGWQKYADTLALTGFDLGQYVLDHATPDHYARFFIPGKEPEGGYKSRAKSDDADGEQGEGTAVTTAPAGPAVDEARVANFAAQLRDRGPAPAAQ